MPVMTTHRKRVQGSIFTFRLILSSATAFPHLLGVSQSVLAWLRTSLSIQLTCQRTEEQLANHEKQFKRKVEFMLSIEVSRP